MLDFIMQTIYVNFICDSKFIKHRSMYLVNTLLHIPEWILFSDVNMDIWQSETSIGFSAIDFLIL